jgi:hypothetical protein
LVAFYMTLILQHHKQTIVFSLRYNSIYSSVYITSKCIVQRVSTRDGTLKELSTLQLYLI